MGSFSDVFEVDVLKALVGQATTILTTTPLTNVYCALYTTNPTDSTNGTEVTGGSYARIEVSAKFGTAPSAGSVSNDAAVNFATATADWGTVTGFALRTESSGTAGSLLAWGALSANKVVSNGDTASFAIGALTITLD